MANWIIRSSRWIEPLWNHMMTLLTMLEQTKNTCEQVFVKRLRELRKENGYTIEQFADMVGISKSTLGYYEKDKCMPDIEILARISNVLNVNADYLICRTNATAQKGKMKTVCEFTGLSNNAAEFLAQLVKKKDYAKLEIINHLFQELCEDYDFYSTKRRMERKQQRSRRIVPLP
ncbi:MAG: helix-turn-helix transcriptional regulator [Ruminiclostridium sp.]|nr:helix-turn-helix transcriptional regulator [Ruminiclostridium sp.]